jgi:lysophospholipase L1-like esterase
VIYGNVKLNPGARLLFIGDSVTDCNRLRPVGRGSRSALGEGYVAEVDKLLAQVHPRRPVRITNMGVSGNTVRDLAARWDTDVIALEPEWLAVMIGINDVWRQFDGVDGAAAVPLEEYFDTYDGLLTRTRPLLKGLVLMTPYYVQGERRDIMRLQMDEYGRVVRDLAARHRALFADTQEAIDSVLTRLDYKVVAPDRVHPTEIGHSVLAHAFLRAVGFKPLSRR